MARRLFLSTCVAALPGCFVWHGSTGDEWGRDSGTDTDTGTDAGTDADADSHAGTGTDADADSDAGTDSDSDWDSDSGTGTGTDSDSGTDADADADSDADSDAGTLVEYPMEFFPAADQDPHAIVTHIYREADGGKVHELVEVRQSGDPHVLWRMVVTDSFKHHVRLSPEGRYALLLNGSPDYDVSDAYVLDLAVGTATRVHTETPLSCDGYSFDVLPRSDLFLWLCRWPSLGAVISADGSVTVLVGDDSPDVIELTVSQDGSTYSYTTPVCCVEDAHFEVSVGRLTPAIESPTTLVLPWGSYVREVFSDASLLVQVVGPCSGDTLGTCEIRYSRFLPDGGEQVLTDSLCWGSPFLPPGRFAECPEEGHVVVRRMDDPAIVELDLPCATEPHWGLGGAVLYYRSTCDGQDHIWHAADGRTFAIPSLGAWPLTFWSADGELFFGRSWDDAGAALLVTATGESFGNPLEELEYARLMWAHPRLRGESASALFSPDYFWF